MSQKESPKEFAVRMGIFEANRRAFPQEELLKYVDEWIAWSPDGTAILAHSAESETDVYEQLESNGHDLGKCCISYVDDPDEVILGSISIFLDPSRPRRKRASCTENGAVKNQDRP